MKIITYIDDENDGNTNKCWYDLNYIPKHPYNDSYQTRCSSMIDINATFKNDLKDPKNYQMLFNSFKQINDKGFYATPTVVINGEVITDAFSEKEIDDAIINEMSKIK